MIMLRCGACVYILCIWSLRISVDCLPVKFDECSSEDVLDAGCGIILGYIIGTKIVICIVTL